jgi:hypothetical protein
LWPNIRFLPSIVAEKNATKNGHIQNVCSMFSWFLYTLNIYAHFSSHFSKQPDIWSQASYRCSILWEAFLDPSDSYFLFADLVDFYTHWTYILYMPIFSRIFLSNYWLNTYYYIHM